MEALDVGNFLTSELGVLKEDGYLHKKRRRTSW